MPTFENPAADADEVQTALRALAHATRAINDPRDIYSVLGSLTSALGSLSQSLHQLAGFHDGATTKAKWATEDSPKARSAAYRVSWDLHRAGEMVRQVGEVVENAHEKVGEVIASLLGTAWSVMTFFVVPVLVVEKVGPFAAVGRSISLLKKTWGEALVGNMGLNFVMFLLAIPVILLFVAGGVLLAMGHAAPGVAFLVLGGVALLLHMAISSALHTILLAALALMARAGW